MILPPAWLHQWLQDLTGLDFPMKAQPELCLFFNEVAEKWATEFPPGRRGLDQ